jgi:hypothetical protein
VRREVAVANEACSFHALTLTPDILNQMDEELGFKAIQEEPLKDPNSNILRTTAYRRAYILSLCRSSQGRGPTSAYQDLGTVCFVQDPSFSMRLRLRVKRRRIRMPRLRNSMLCPRSGVSLLQLRSLTRKSPFWIDRTCKSIKTMVLRFTFCRSMLILGRRCRNPLRS